MCGFIRWRAFCAAFWCVSLTACAELADGPTIAFEHLGSSKPLPVSGNDNLAVAKPDFVCLFDSYEKELACGDLAWTDTMRFGRSGEGPGELGDYGILVSTSSDGVGFVDLPNNRISVFTRQGYLRQLPLPPSLHPASDISQDGIYVAYGNPRTLRAGGMAFQEIRAENADLVREVRLNIDSVGTDEPSGLVSGATQLRNGDFIVRKGNKFTQSLLRFTAGGSFVGYLDMPEFPPQLPDARDIEIFKEALAEFPAGPAFARAIEEFGERPMLRLPGNTLFRIVQMDPEGRVLLLTTLRSSTGTYVEVYSGLDYVGRALLRGRVLAIQVVDGILVALSEEMQSEDLIPKRRLEWYGFGSAS